MSRNRVEKSQRISNIASFSIFKRASNSLREYISSLKIDMLPQYSTVLPRLAPCLLCQRYYVVSFLFCVIDTFSSLVVR